MARFDIYPGMDASGYVLDVQSNLLEPLNTRVVIPLLPKRDVPKPAERLNPVFRIGRKDYVMVTQFLAAVPLAQLGQAIDNLSQHQSEITAAMDMLTHGF